MKNCLSNHLRQSNHENEWHHNLVEEEQEYFDETVEKNVDADSFTGHRISLVESSPVMTSEGFSVKQPSPRRDSLNVVYTPVSQVVEWF